MLTTRRAVLSVLLAAAPGIVLATDKVAGDRHVFRSPNGVTETCVALARMPGGVYSDEDQAQERALCGIDIYDRHVAVCPKLKSTSPGTFVYALTRGGYAGDQRGFEAKVCPRGDIVAPEADGPPAGFKVTMNAKGTSGTFATASLLYYHFARYLDASVRVPVSVYRSIDRKAHDQRVTQRGLALSAGKRPLAMNHAAWQALDAVEQNPAAYPEADELFTADRTRVQGVLQHVSGKRYGPELNGTRKSGWGEGQNRDFQETAPFLALRSEQPLEAAIAEGLAKAQRDPALKKAMKDGVSKQQIAYWMQDLTEITLLDYVFSQQDRIGNIDYLPYWHWVDGGKVRTAKAQDGSPPAEAVGKDPQLLRRTWLNDNDAGGKVKYANFTKKTGMLEKVRHYHPETYRRLIALDKDFTAKGKLYAYLRDTFGLTEVQLALAVEGTHEAAAILKAGCKSGRLRFDLDPDAYLATGKAVAHTVDCENPHGAGSKGQTP
jgi:hypothetical protein